MTDETLLFWGMLVTMFLAIAALITARDMVESQLRSTSSSEDDNAA